MTTIRDQINAITNAKPGPAELRKQRRELRKLREEKARSKVYVADHLKPIRYTPSFLADKLRQEFNEHLHDNIASCTVEIEKFKVRMAEEPYRAFDWSKDTVKAAGQQVAYARVVEQLAHVDRMDDGYRGGSNLQNLKWTREWLTSEIMRATRYNNATELERWVFSGYAVMLEWITFRFSYRTQELGL